MLLVSCIWYITTWYVQRGFAQSPGYRSLPPTRTMQMVAHTLQMRIFRRELLPHQSRSEIPTESAGTAGGRWYVCSFLLNLSYSFSTSVKRQLFWPEKNVPLRCSISSIWRSGLTRGAETKCSNFTPPQRVEEGETSRNTGGNIGHTLERRVLTKKNSLKSLNCRELYWRNTERSWAGADIKYIYTAPDEKYKLMQL